MTTLSPFFFFKELSSQPDLLQQIASSLVKAGLYEKAGDLYERARSYQQAMEAYREGAVFRRAVELARVAYPVEVVGLEEGEPRARTTVKFHRPKSLQADSLPAVLAAF